MLSLVRIRYEGEPLEDPLEYVGNPNDDVEFSVAQEEGYSQWRISLSTATFQRVDLAIYDIRGSRVRTLLESDGISGTFEIVWDGRDDNEQLLPGGVYFVRLSQPANVETAKVVLMR
jgi:flagellar hook assembly protein FlgD